MISRVRVLAVAALLLAVPPAPAGTQPADAPQVTAPREEFGADIGDDYFLATWVQFERYWRKLDRESDRVQVVEIGDTAEGRPQLMAIVSSPDNLRRLERYREIARRLARADGLTDDEARALAREGRAIVWIDGGVHGNETLGAQQLIETVYQLASRSDAETQRFLRDVIVLAVHANPDGHALAADWYMRSPDPTRRSLRGVRRLFHKYAGHDLNRDFYMSTQAETINMNRVLYREWYPQIVYDHHQTGPPGTVMFAPPFSEPFNYVFDPLIRESVDLVGAAMHDRFAAEDKRGVTMRSGSSYSAWWNGGLRTTAYFHNQIGLLTETIGGPTPTAIPFVVATQQPSADLPLPITPQSWRFRQSIEYSLTANRAVLDYASRQRETLLFNVYRMGKNSIGRGNRDTWTTTPPRSLDQPRDPRLRDARGYILPSDQPDFPTATKFVNALIRAGVDVHRARAPFEVTGREYPTGSYVVKTAQAFRPHVLDMFEPQHYPDDLRFGGPSPASPYDSVGWTLAFQMGVRFDRILEGFDGPFEVLDGEAEPPRGRITGVANPTGFLVTHHQNDVFIVVNRLLAAGDEVYWLADRNVGPGPPGTGAMYVPASPSTRARLDRARVELGLSFTGVASPPAGEALKLRPVRIALVDVFGGSAPSGWTRWLLERFEFPFDVVSLDTLATGGQTRPYDVWILPSDVVPGRSEAATLRRRVEEGDTLLAIGGATAVSRLFDLPVSSALVEPRPDGTLQALPRSAFFVPGSLMRVRVDNTTPLGYGFDGQVDVFFDESPVFTVDDGARAARVAWFSGTRLLRSGWARGERHLDGGAAVVDAALGGGRVLLFGPEITFRAQSHGTFKFLFNGIFYGAAQAARP